MTLSTDLAPLILRLTLGLILIAHGLRHLRGRQRTEAWVEGIGLRNPTLQWFFMSFAEIGVGISLSLGLLTTVGAAALVALMAVAIWTVHRHAGFWITARPDEGWEYALLIGSGAVAVALLGPGAWSIDHLLGIADDLDGATGLAIAAAGVVAAIGQLAAFYRPDPPAVPDRG